MENIENELNVLLKTHFKLDKLKSLQTEIILNIIKGYDVIGILPTGFGKSICYQLPYLYMKKNIIVISPLLALMEDQARQLTELNIPVCCLNSNNKNKKQDIDDIIYCGETKIIYVTPEYLLINDNFIPNLYKQNLIGLICIDEAHVMSSWGNNFRPDYLKLSLLKEYVQDVPFLALSATATKKVQNDIANNLKMNNPIKIIGDFDRPNLNLYVTPLGGADGFITKVKPILERFKNDKILVYCKTKDTTDQISDKINKIGIKCKSYHADKDTKTRSKIQEKYTNNKIKCIVATVAFGMGINLPDVRVVIHYNSPGNLESYYQEIGRAGRDGAESYCYMFYSDKDYATSKYFLADTKNPLFKKYQEDELQTMVKYAYTTGCRREILLGHFNDSYKISDCKKCDNCINKTKLNTKNRDFTEEAYLFLDLINKFNNSFGFGTFILILKGSNIQKIQKFKNTASEYYGKGNDYCVDWWKYLSKQLIIKNFLKENSIPGSKYGGTIQITNFGLKWYNEIKQLKNDKIDYKNKLVIDVPDHFIKIDKIKNNIITNNIITNNIITNNVISDKTKPTWKITCELLQQGMCIKTIAESRGIHTQTVEGHITTILENKNVIELDKYITKIKYQEISQKLNSAIEKDMSLSNIREKLNKQYSYLELKITIALNKLNDTEFINKCWRSETDKNHIIKLHDIKILNEKTKKICYDNHNKNIILKNMIKDMKLAK
jgi:Werner syndrome ATP-dependent helicase